MSRERGRQLRLIGDVRDSIIDSLDDANGRQYCRMLHIRTQALVQLGSVVAVVRGANLFQSECTIPPEGTNYVDGPYVRSTLSILWTSLVTVFLCTWTVQHLSIPERHQSTLRAFWRKLKWMLIMTIVPEFTVGKALGDWVAASASTSCPAMQERARASKTQWTMTHAFYANMGGFLLHNHTCQDTQRTISSPRETPAGCSCEAAQVFPSPSSESVSLSDRIKRRIFHRNGKTHLWQERPCRSMEEKWTRFVSDNIEVKYPFAVNSAQLCILLAEGVIDRLPPITEDEINDRSKEDLAVKLLALLQVLQLVVQLLTRRHYDLPTSQLEIAVLSFATCTAITYVFWLRKPKDIKIPTDLSAARELDAAIKGQLVWLNDGGFFKNNMGTSAYASLRPTIPSDAYSVEADLGIRLDAGMQMASEDVGFALGGVIFGACHCIAWDFPFPTPIEQKLWRASILLTTAVIPAHYLLAWLLSWVSKGKPKVSRVLFKVVMVLWVLYALSRVFILAEALRSLFYLPSDAFVSTWSSVIPHIG